MSEALPVETFQKQAALSFARARDVFHRETVRILERYEDEILGGCLDALVEAGLAVDRENRVRFLKGTGKDLSDGIRSRSPGHQARANTMLAPLNPDGCVSEVSTIRSDACFRHNSDINSSRSEATLLAEASRSVKHAADQSPRSPPHRYSSHESVEDRRQAYQGRRQLSFKSMPSNRSARGSARGSARKQEVKILEKKGSRTSSWDSVRRAVKGFNLQNRLLRKGSKAESFRAKLSDGSSSGSDPVSSTVSKRSVFSRLEVLPVWDEKQSASLNKNNLKKKKMSIPTIASVARFRSSVSGGLMKTASDGAGAIYDHSFMQRFMMLPASPVCLVWDAITAAAIIHDIIVVPLRAFDLPDSFFMSFLQYTTMIVWILDLILSFVRGQANADGIIEMRPAKVARLYLNSWFILDFSVVAVDIILVCLEGSEWAKAATLLRLTRLLRLVRVAKLVRIWDRISVFKEYFHSCISDFNSEKKTAIMGIVRLLGIVLIITHFIACGWYGIASVGEAQGMYVWFQEEHLFQKDDGLLYRYLTSAHWAITQFSPASMEVTPRNALERFYNLGVIVMGLLMFSGLVSNMTQAMLHLRDLSAKDKQLRQDVRRFLNSHQVSAGLSSTVMSYLSKHRDVPNKKRPHEEDIAAIKTLPDGILWQLREEAFGVVLSTYPVFDFLNREHDPTFAHLCHVAVKEERFRNDEVVFRYDDIGKHFFHIVVGRFAYYLGMDREVDEYCDPGRWVSEASLWCAWDYVGRLVCDDRCGDIYKIEAVEFQSYAANYGNVAILQAYANLWAARTAKECEGTDDITDLTGTRQMQRQLIVKAAQTGDHETRFSNLRKIFVLLEDDTAVMQNAFDSWKEVMRMSKLKESTCCSWLTSLICPSRTPTTSYLQPGRLSDASGNMMMTATTAGSSMQTETVCFASSEYASTQMLASTEGARTLLPGDVEDLRCNSLPLSNAPSGTGPSSPHQRCPPLPPREDAPTLPSMYSSLEQARQASPRCQLSEEPRLGVA